jgi:hypothetical protein
VYKQSEVSIFIATFLYIYICIKCILYKKAKQSEICITLTFLFNIKSISYKKMYKKQSEVSIFIVTLYIYIYIYKMHSI